MDYFQYKDQQLFAEQLSFQAIADQFGTPCYVYSKATIERHWHAFYQVFKAHDHLICYAVKANSNLAILHLLASMGSGFDVVSGGELQRVIRAGGDVAKVVFSGVGKTRGEIEFALDAGIYSFNVESLPELDRINDVAQSMGKEAPVSIRVNPDVDAGTHPYISTGLKENKFGLDVEAAYAACKTAYAMSSVRLMGLDCHIGSQLTELAPFEDALARVLVLIDRLDEEGIAVEHIDMGGGLGINYRSESPPLPDQYATVLLGKLKGRALKLIIEPGRAIMGNAGVLLTTVEYIKRSTHKNFAIVDAAMNDLIRPALYSAWQDIIEVNRKTEREKVNCDVVGPICETGDFLGKDRSLAIAQGDLLVVRSSGAYGFSMASNYNSRPRPPEVLVDGDQAHLIRARESVEDLWKGEVILPVT